MHFYYIDPGYHFVYSSSRSNKYCIRNVFYKNFTTMKIEVSLIFAAILMALTASAQNMRYGFTAGV